MKSWSLKMKIEPQHWIKMDAWKHPFRWPSLKFEPHPPRDGSPSKMTQGIHRHWNYPKAPHRLSFRGSCCGRSWRRGRGKGLLPVLLWDAGILDKPVYMTSTRSVKGRPVLFKKNGLPAIVEPNLTYKNHPSSCLAVFAFLISACSGCSKVTPGVPEALPAVHPASQCAKSQLPTGCPKRTRKTHKQKTPRQHKVNLQHVLKFPANLWAMKFLRNCHELYDMFRIWTKLPLRVVYSK